MTPKFYNSDAAAEHYLGIRWPRAIWAAVLEQAALDATVGPARFEFTGSDAERAELASNVRAAARDWINDDTNEPRRFVWVCEVLNLEPAAVRAAILREYPQ